MTLLRSFAALTFAALATVASARASELPAHVDVRADSVGFYPYSDNTFLAADGRVRVLAGKRTIEADSFRYDLLKNKLLASGNVFVRGEHNVLAGAAYALDLESGNATLLKSDPVPSTWALHDDDLAGAVRGPAPPGTFGAYDLAAYRPYIRSRHAYVTTNANVRMTPAEFPAGGNHSLTTPSFLYTFAYNPNFAQNTFPYTSFDQPYPLFGNANSLSAAHLRYDAANGVNLGVDEHLVAGNRAYVAASVLLLRSRRFDLHAFQQIRSGVQQDFSAFHLAGADYARYQLQWSGKATVATYAITQYNGSHNQDLTFGLQERTIPHLGSYAATVGYGFERNPGAQPFARDFKTSASAFLATPTISTRFFNLSGRYDWAMTFYDYAREQTNGTLSINLSRNFGRVVSLFGTVSFLQSNNRYRNNGAQYLYLPDPKQPYFAPDGTPFPGYFAYAGLNTYRTYQIVSTFTGLHEQRFQVTLTHTHDFPQYHGYGRPPLTASFDMTERLAPNVRVEFGRSYVFGWNKEYFSPQWNFAVSP